MLLKAIKSNPYSIKHIKSEYLQEHEILEFLKVMKDSRYIGDTETLYHILNADSYQITDEVIKKLPSVYRTGDEMKIVMNKYPQLIDDYLNISDYYLSSVPEEYKRNPEIYKSIIEEHPDLFSALPDDLKTLENVTLSSKKLFKELMI